MEIKTGEIAVAHGAKPQFHPKGLVEAFLHLLAEHRVCAPLVEKRVVTPEEQRAVANYEGKRAPEHWAEERVEE